MGGLAERGRVLPAYGFSHSAKSQVLDLEHPRLGNQGGHIETGSGVAGLAYSWVLGRRNDRELLNFRPHNVSLVGLGSECRLLYTQIASWLHLT